MEGGRKKAERFDVIGVNDGRWRLWWLRPRYRMEENLIVDRR